jgi:hypothetical protein
MARMNWTGVSESHPIAALIRNGNFQVAVSNMSSTSEDSGWSAWQRWCNVSFSLSSGKLLSMMNFAVIL